MAKGWWLEFDGTIPGLEMVFEPGYGKTSVEIRPPRQNYLC